VVITICQLCGVVLTVPLSVSHCGNVSTKTDYADATQVICPHAIEWCHFYWP